MPQSNQIVPEEIDLDRLRRDYLADDAFLIDILDTFVKEVNRVSHEIEALREHPTGEAIRKLAHRLKGSLRAVALFSTAEAMGRLESAANSVAYGEPDLIRLVKEFGKVIGSARYATTIALGSLAKPAQAPGGPN
jgi:HPt (histidine-containing phosphotransfer) domain-containing protein